MSMWSNGIKCEYKFMFPLKNLARKGLRLCKGTVKESIRGTTTVEELINQNSRNLEFRFRMIIFCSFH